MGPKRLDCSLSFIPSWEKMFPFADCSGASGCPHSFLSTSVWLLLYTRHRAGHIKESVYSLVGAAAMQIDCSLGIGSCGSSVERQTSSARSIREGFLEVQAWQRPLGQGGWNVCLSLQRCCFQGSLSSCCFLVGDWWLPDLCSLPPLNLSLLL